MRVGSLFTGYGGLDMAVLAHFGGTLAWYAEAAIRSQFQAEPVGQWT